MCRIHCHNTLIKSAMSMGHLKLFLASSKFTKGLSPSEELEPKRAKILESIS